MYKQTTCRLTVAAAQVSYDYVDLYHFCHVCGWSEYIGVDKSLDDASLAKSRTGRICEVLEQADDTAFEFDIGFPTQH